MPIISILNNKGGVGKTTTTFQLGAYLASKGNKVLLIDFDAQGSLTEKVGDAINNIDYDVVDLLKSSAEDLKNAKFFTNEDGTLYSLKGTKEINIYLNVNREDDPSMWEERRRSLKNHAVIINKMWDYILIDCPPTMILPELLTPSEVALFASDYIIVPTCADKDSISGFSKVMTAFQLMKRENPKLRLLGMVFTLVQLKEIVFLQYKALMEEMCKGGVFKTAIRRSAEMQQALNLNRSIFSYKENSISAQDYTAFGEEVLEKISNYQN